MQAGSGNDVLIGGANGTGDIGDYMMGGTGYDVFYFTFGDSGGASPAVDVISDFVSGGDLIAILGFAAVFLGEQAGFSDIAGAEAYFEHTQRDGLDDVTNIHVRDAIGLTGDFELSLIGHIDLTANDVFLI
ncbi:M10 family metallopeptidase C-terminal domain-containing protein [Lutimaribacter marinistellae]|uniref:M10 family metallopeptidase C-terminal domain-containing protein n=1 Tax=Lutimaribacter marinistellae TaxID=1820329 RepID=A0ABV7TAG4_9RHOB